MKRKVFLIAFVLLCILGLCTYAGSAVCNADKILSKAELSGSTVYLHNINCGNYPEYEVYTVTNSKIIEDLIGNVIHAEKLRPFVMVYELKLGGKENSPALNFTTNDCSYSVTFLDVNKQLSNLDSIYRENPYILISKDSLSGATVEEWTWYCTLSADKYATLINMIETYWDDTQPVLFSEVKVAGK